MDLCWVKFKTFKTWSLRLLKHNSCRKTQLGDIKLLSNGSLVVTPSIKMPNFPFVRKKACEMFEFTVRFETVSRK